MLIDPDSREPLVDTNLEPNDQPTRLQSGVHSLKVLGVTARHLIRNALDPSVVRHQQQARPDWPLVAESKSPIWTNDAPGEWELEVGKVENLRRATRLLDGVVVPAGALFSFWAHVGRPTRRRGFVEGREILQGCVVPSIGGGLCQLSNALYDAALTAGFEIVERHRHSRIVPGSMAENDRDATVFWPHIDLRFRSANAFAIEARLTRDEFIIRLRVDVASHRPTPRPTKQLASSSERPSSHQNCLNCHKVECFRYWQHRKLARQPGERSAFLLDRRWPEFDRYVEETARDHDFACIPLPGRELGNERYAWRLRGVRDVRHLLALTALRALHTRLLSAQGAARQRALLEWDRLLAEVMAHHLGARTTRVVVSQNLLPYLWKSGHLQGRRVDVLMTRHPVSELHRRLDRAAKLHPQSPTLGDFRAPRWLVEAEDAALDYAERLVTPHSAVAEFAPHKTTVLDWRLPDVEPPAGGQPIGERPTIVFPASTVGRKGAYELREAVAGLDVDLRVLGRDLEGAEFWNDHRVRRGDRDWLADAAVVVLPAHIEHQPRLLLRAVAAGIPVITSRACGLSNLPGVCEVPTGDTAALRDAIVEHSSGVAAPYSVA